MFMPSGTPAQTVSRVHPFRLMATALALAALMTGCARMPPGAEPAGHVSLMLPGSGWTPLGPVASVTVPSGGAEAPAQRQVMALPNPQGGWLATVVLTATRAHTWQAPDQPPRCVPAPAEQVESLVSTGPTRIDCLRARLYASQQGWMQKHHADADAVFQSLQALPPAPYAWASHTYTTDSGIYIRLDMVMDQRLVEPKTRSNAEFLEAGRPFEAWTRQLARAVRTSSGMWDGRLALPPFPLPQP
jgi:hypothetical protein